MGYVGALEGSMVGLKVALEGGRVRWLAGAFCFAGDVARTGTNGGGLFDFVGLGDGLGIGGRVVVRSAPGVRLAANVREVLDGPATAFLGVAVIMRAE